ncbi:MAG TPA: hypothetical protein VE057_22965 [Archangium sp.]|nr:hypothetical protein [Archangium sp.]
MGVFAGKGECTTCHGGPLLTDNGFHNIGVAGDDPGRLEAGATPRALFKTPSLRDVTRTAPYFHDGSAATLEEVIEHYYAGTQVKVDVRGVQGVEGGIAGAIPEQALVSFCQALAARLRASRTAAAG